jgi:CRISPR-associated protein Cmr1
MERLEYELEFITPAFIGGADPSQAELRPASIVGMLRWWWRLLNWDNNYQNLFKKESELFGNTNEAGKVWIRVKGNVKQKLSRCEKWDARIREGRDLGKVYLGYGNILFVNFNRENNRQKYKLLYELCKRPGDRIEPKGNFTVRGYLKGLQPAVLEVLCPPDVKQDIEALLYVVSQLGTIGGRSRRGWGSFYLKPKRESGFSSWDSWNTEELMGAVEFISGKSLGELGIEIYKLGISKEDPMEALEEIGRVFREFRSRRNPDYRNLKNLLDRKVKDKSRVLKQIEQDSIHRAYFGLPLKFRYSSLGGNEVSIDSVEGRQASPVRFRIVKEQNKYSVVIVRTKNMPLVKKLVIKFGRESKHIDAPDDRVFTEFMSYLKKNKGIDWRLIQ